MKSLLLRSLALITILMSLAACGGGGGGGGNGGSGGGQNQPISVTIQSINLNANRNDSTLPSTAFNIFWSDPQVFQITVGVPPGQTVPPWLGVSLDGNTSPIVATVRVLTTDLAAGTYNVTLRVVSSNAQGNVLTSIDIPVTYTVTNNFSVDPDQLEFNYVLGNAQAPPSQSLSISGAGVNWSATADQPWVSTNPTSGTSPTTVDVSVDPSGLGTGTHTATVTLTNDGNMAETIDVTVTLNVLAPSVVLGQSNLSFDGVNGGNFFFSNVSFRLTNLQVTAWTASASEPWIVLNETSWTGPDTARISVDPSIGALASGSYTGEVTFSTTYLGAPISAVVNITMNLTPATLSLITNSLSFQGGPVEDFYPRDLEFAINTGGNLHPWDITFNTNTGGAWLTSTTTSGTVSNSTRGVAPITVDTTELTDDNYAGSIDIQVTINGDVVNGNVPVDLVLEPHRLVVADDGVALMTSPGLSKLSHTVRVSENRRITTDWTATSDQSWLTVTPSGTTDGDLAITADPTGLAVEQIHYANVTVESTTPTITNSGQEVVRVGFYVTATTPAAQVTTAIQQFGSGFVADPVRPYVYVANFNDPDVEVYNIYTGALENTISNVGTDVRELTISSDGDMLYAIDFPDYEIVSVDLSGAQPVVNPAWSNPVWASCNCIGDFGVFQYTRTNGREVLIGGITDIIDANTGERLFGRQERSFLLDQVGTDITENGSVLFFAGQQTGPHSVGRYVLTYSEIDDAFSMTSTASERKLGFNRGLFTDPPGDRVFRVCNYANNEIEIYDGGDLSTISTVSGSQLNGAAQYGPDDLVYCTRYLSAFDGSPDLWSIDPASRVIQAEYNVAGEIEQDRWAFSGDGLRLIMRNDSATELSLITIQ